MLKISGASVFLSKSEINDIYIVSLIVNTHDEIVWFNIPVNNMLVMDILYSMKLNK